MTRGTLNLKIVGDRLDLIADCLNGLRKLPATSLEEFSSDYRNPATAESLLRRAVQAVFDLLRHMTAKAHGRGLLEYKELARIAREKSFIQDPELLKVLDQLAGFRNRLTHFYDEVTSEELYGILRNDLEDLERIAEELRRTAAGLAGGSPTP
ncbi:MAG TPA: DUF86 domain-containing protein [Thermoanaerobaculia bacterium]|nr:DUF86 domain-containing protein [Thermoanaerobaculia bacterium]